MTLQIPAGRARTGGARGAGGTSLSLTARHGIGFAMNPCASLLRLHAEAGPVAAVGSRRKPLVHLFGPDANAFVFANSGLFRWREAFDLLVPVNGETALIVSDGADHRRRRRLVQPAFHHRRVGAYVERMAANTGAALDGWRPGRTLDAYAELRSVIRRSTVEFRPERWDPSSDLYRPATPATYLPFGGGPHRCIGSTLATVELKTMLACLLRRTRLRLVSPAAAPTSVTAMRPRGGVPVEVLG